jgi:hypothetical protein
MGNGVRAEPQAKPRRSSAADGMRRQLALRAEENGA